MTLKTLPYDTAEFLDDDESITAYLEEAFATGEAAVIVRALGTAARARTLTELAQKTGLSRSALFEALSGESKTEFETILRIARALGLDLTVRPRVPNAA
ncbi:MAG TPA: addiction module antidote protein [Mesorhizobium sp.]|jgi:probable addiction module antidote protein|nr:addiction module antidote protein [Mesorhizobium sp.]